MSITISKFLGLHNTADPKSLPPGALIQADNIDISREGLISRRAGYSPKISGTSITSSYVTRDASRFFIVDSGTLTQVNADLSTTALAQGLPNTELFWDDASGYVFLSNGLLIHPDSSVENLIIPDPAQPSIAATTGQLKAGRYQIACAYMNDRGREGPVSLPYVCTVLEGSGLMITPVFAAGYKIVLYLSSPDGDLLYRAAVLSEGAYLFTDAGLLSSPVDDRQIGTTEMPGGVTHLAFYEARLYVATYYNGFSTIWFSQDYWWNLFDSQSDYILLPGRITALKASAHGLVIGLESEFWLYNDGALTRLAAYGAPDGRAIAVDAQGDVLAWTKRGVATLLPYQNLTEQTVSLPPGGHVSATIVREKGQRRLLVLTDNAGEAYNSF